MTQRRPRRDAQLNRERIVDAPTDVIAEDGPNASLDKIASTAGVGAGTRYRHFPTRNDLLAAVFTGRIEALCDEAAALRENSEPPDALQRRLVAMLDHAMTDNGLLEALALTGSKPEIDCSAMILDAASALLDQARHAGTIRSDITPDDLLRLVIGIGLANDTPSQARHLPNVTLDGLRFN